MAGKMIDLAGQIIFGSIMMAVDLVKIISSPEVYTSEGPRVHYFQDSFIFFIHTGGSEIYLSWCNVDTHRISVAVLGKDLPDFHEWMLCSLNALPCDFIETNKKNYLQLETKEQKIGTQTVVDTESDECD